MYNINQNHYGNGDNVAGDKIIKVESLRLDDYSGETLKEKVKNFIHQISPEALNQIEKDRVIYIDLTPMGVRILLSAQKELFQQEIISIEDRHNLRIEPGKDQLSGYTLRALRNF